MTPLFIYLLKVAIINALMIGFYHFAIRPGRNFGLMRWVLLAAVVLPLILPLIPQPVMHQGEAEIPLYVISLPEVQGAATISAEAKPSIIPDIRVLIYASVVLLMMLATMVSVLSVARRLRLSKVKITLYGKIYIDETAVSPFSFFKWVFFPDKSLEHPDADLLLRHEFSHVKRHHSIDRLISATFRAFFWFSPFAHFNHRLLSEVHEYQADADAIAAFGDKAGYNQLIVSYAGIPGNNPITNPFSAHLKKRIIMLNHLKPGKLSLTAIVTGIVLIASVAVFSSMVQPQKTNSSDMMSDDEFQSAALSESLSLPEVTVFPVGDGSTAISDDTTLVPAQYPGGDEARILFFKNNLRYPAEARNRNIQGTVEYKFTVEADGKVTSVEIVSGIGSGCDEEVLRVAALMPAWKPATKGGKPVKSTMVLPVKFTLSNGTNESDDVFTVVEKSPSFPGGDDARAAHFGKVMTYPESARKDKVEGTVYVTFIVEKDGSLSNVRILRGVRKDLDEVALRVINSMPLWEPGTQRGEPVRVQFNMPIKFKLSEEKSEVQKEVKKESSSEVKTSAMIDGREVFMVVDEAPEYPGGSDALFKYLGEKNKYTEEAIKQKIEGTIYIGFTVEPDGSISNARVLRGIGGGLDEVAVNSIMNMPKWKPGKNGGVAVPVQFNIPVKFKLDADSPDKPVEMPEKSMYLGREVYNKVDVSPEFPGGNEAFLAYLRKYIGNVEFSNFEDSKTSLSMIFVVEPDGRITPGAVSENADAVVKLTPKLQEALKNMPVWKPGKTKGVAVPVRELIFLKIINQ
jgi:TonB family protein